MGLPDKFDRRLKSSIGLRSVWLPGTEFELGDILLSDKETIFQPIAKLGDFGLDYRERNAAKKIYFSFQARGVSSTVTQAGVKVDTHALDVKANAQLKIDFKQRDTYFIRTPVLVGSGISNLLQIGKKVAKLTDWRFKDYYIVTQVFRAEEFVFLGNQKKNSSILFRGLGGAILDFLTFGLSANVRRASSSSISIEIIGTGGPVAIDVVRFKRNGQLY